MPPKVLEIAVCHKVNTFWFNSFFFSSSQLEELCFNAIASTSKLAKVKCILKCNRNAFLNSYLYFPGTRPNRFMRHGVLKTLDWTLLSPCFSFTDPDEIC